MAKIELKNIHHTYASSRDKNAFSIDALSMTWEDGSANALLGPSGCGKTTLLNILSGLLVPKGGQVLFDGRDVTRSSPKERHIAQVFQFPVVYDTMTVFDNLAFPLRNSGHRDAQMRPRVEEIAELLGLHDILRERARGLTPALKQKISLGRGIVREDTAAVLLDEPLTVIDPKLKWDLRRMLRDVQRALNMTMIYVTHDQHEALTFADRVTVMNDGRILQTGSPQELHDDPATPFVGFFIGSPGMNILDAHGTETGVRVGDHTIPLSRSGEAGRPKTDQALRLGIRPEHVDVSAVSVPDALPCTVTIVEDTGAYKILSLAAEGLRFKARVPEDSPLREGDRAWTQFPEQQLKLFPAREGRS